MRSARAVRRKPPPAARSSAPSSLGQDACDAAPPRRLGRREPAGEALEMRPPKGLDQRRAGEPGEMRVGDASQLAFDVVGQAVGECAGEFVQHAVHDLAAQGARQARRRAPSSARASGCPGRRSRKDWRSTARCGSRSVSSAAPRAAASARGPARVRTTARGRARAPTRPRAARARSCVRAPAALISASSRCSQRDGTVGTPSTFTARVR